MPELPEVETSRRGIAPYVEGQRIDHVDIRERRLRWPVTTEVDEQLAGATVESVERRAKYLLFNTRNGAAIIHLGMSAVSLSSNAARLPASTNTLILACHRATFCDSATRDVSGHCTGQKSHSRTGF